jgi:peptide/nickel transport system ATP-binding protein
MSDSKTNLPDADETSERGDIVLQVEDLRMYLHTRWGVTKAVDGVTFDLRAGETLGIVGESGSGKSMLALSLVRLTPEPASRFEGGKVLLNGVDLVALSDRKMRKIRGKQISMILQDPQQSLNPVFTVGNQLEEAIRIHGAARTKGEAHERAIDALREVHVPEPERNGDGLHAHRVDRRRTYDRSRCDHSGSVPQAPTRPSAQNGRRHDRHLT